MKKLLLIGTLLAPFFSTGLYAAGCSDTGTDGYDDECDAVMRLELPVFAIVEFPTANGDGSDLRVIWDGTPTGTSSDSISICIGTNSTTDVNVTASSVNSFEVSDGSTTVAYSLDLNTTLDLTSGAVVLPNAAADDLACTATNIPLELSFDNSVLAAASTDGTTPFTDTVTITVAPQ